MTREHEASHTQSDSRSIHHESHIGVIVLAAGASTRMGESKQLLHYRGETLVRRAAGAALVSQCRPVIVVIGAQSDGLRDEVAGTGAIVAVNHEWAKGMGSSIHCGVSALEAITEGRAEAVVLTLCDQPFVTGQVIDRLVETYGANYPLLIASEYQSKGEKTRGVPALFSRPLFSELLSLQESAGAQRVIARHSSEAIVISVPEAAFDVDTPRDYQNLQRGGVPLG